MGLNHKNLDQRTRTIMLAEIVTDKSAGNTLYLSDNLNQQGRVDYQGLIRDAARSGQRRDAGICDSRTTSIRRETPQLKSGEFSKASSDAPQRHEMLAEGESTASTFVPSVRVTI